MKIETTITAIKNGVCLFESDFIASIDYHIDRYGELEWHVDEYIAEDKRRTWDEMAGKWRVEKISVAVPDKLAEVLDEYLDHAWMEEQIRERIADCGADRADYLRDQMMDR